jgi:very-short-patch-repair endonuclease
VLRQAAPADHQIFAQVRLTNLVQVKPWARRDKSHWWRIQAKCVDFVLAEAATFAPRLVVELDDSSHTRADRRERDTFVDAVFAA